MKYLGVIAIVVIALGAGIYYVINRASTKDVADQVVIESDIAVEDVPITLQENSGSVDVQEAGRYQIFSPEILEEASDTRRVLFFYANWCPTCKPVDEEMTSNMSKIPGDVTVIRVNYNDTETDQLEKDLAKTYGVTYQHTFVQIDAQGNEVTKWNGGGIDKLLENME